MQRTHDAKELKGQPQQKKFRLRKYHSEKGKVEAAVRAACYDDTLAEVELSREPLIIWCYNRKAKRTIALAYWPCDESVGKRLAYTLMCNDDEANRLAHMLIEMATGYLCDTKAAKYPAYGKMRATLVEWFLNKGDSLASLGYFTLMRGASCNTMPPEWSKRAHPLVHECDIASRLYIHCALSDDDDKCDKHDSLADSSDSESDDDSESSDQ